MSLLKISEKNVENLQKMDRYSYQKEFKRLGVVGDFENYYSTMSNKAEAQIVRELGKFLSRPKCIKDLNQFYGL